MCVSACVSRYMSASALGGVRSPGTGMTDGCVPTDTRNCTWLLCKKKQVFVTLSHLLGP